MPETRAIRPLSRRISSAPSLRYPGWAGVFAVALATTGWTVSALAQQLNLTGTSYTQDFDNIAFGLPTGWTVRNSATAASLGNSVSLNTAATPWNTTSGAFYNYAAADSIDPATNALFTGAESATVQAASTDRVLGTRQTNTAVTGGNPGAAFTLQIGNTVDLSNFALSFKAQIISSQPRSTTWTVQYATGANPTTFTNLTTFGDPGGFGSLPVAAPAGSLASIANSLQNIWIRVVALTTNSGSGASDSFGIDDFTLTYDRAAVTSDYWDVNGANNGVGGTSTWDAAAGTPWNSSAAGTAAPIAYDPTHLAVFSGSPGTVTVNGTVTTNRGLQFDSNGYQLTGGTITLAGAAPAITVSNAGQFATIASTLAGTAGLTKAGPGTLILSGTNTYTGGTAINEGTLSISSEANLGAASGGVTFGGGTLATTQNLTFSSTRTLVGAGPVDVAPGTTLTVAGDTSGLNLTLTNTGAVLFSGAAPALAGLTLQKLATVSSTSGSLLIAGNITTQHTAGTVVLADNINLGSVAGSIRLITVADGSDAVDLRIAGNLSIAGGTNARITKLGAGTLELAGTANVISGSLRIGESGTAAINGGTLRIASATAFGGSVFQANAGSVVILNNMTGGNAPAAGVGISIGANSTIPVTFSGADVEFAGPSSLFIGGTDVYENKLVLNNNVIISGVMAAASGAIVPQGLTINGPGSLTFSNAANPFNRPITVDGSTLFLTGAFTSATAKPAITLQNGGTLRGSSTVGNISSGINGTGLIAPGTLTGQLTGVLSGRTLDLRSTTTLALDIRSNLTVSGLLQYDQLVASTDLFIDSTTLTGSIASGANIAVGDLFFIMINGSTDSTLGTFAGLADNTATPAQTTFTGPGGTVTFEISYHGDSTTSTFDASATSGNDIVLRALVPVPEPHSAALLVGAIGGICGFSRARRARANRTV